MAPGSHTIPRLLQWVCTRDSDADRGPSKDPIHSLKPLCHWHSMSEMWAGGDISFEMVDDMTDDPVVTLLVTTPAGMLMFVAEPEERGSTLVLKGVHVQATRPNAIGTANLMVVARALMEGMDLDGLEVEGALRTTGANPGHRPRPFRFSRRVRPAPAPGSGDA